TWGEQIAAFVRPTAGHAPSEEERSRYMHILRIEYPVPDYEAWKASFDADVLGREKSVVRRYRILRPLDDPNYVVIDLKFDGPSEAQAYHVALRDLYSRVTVMRDPRAQIVEVVESKEY
ncbi:MAG: hypothetical protein LC781_01045, partial [Actinobacteria bacterium]|nr:hypothetical protein [Actinomycetota bacterium]